MPRLCKTWRHYDSSFSTFSEPIIDRHGTALTNNGRVEDSVSTTRITNQNREEHSVAGHQVSLMGASRERQLVSADEMSLVELSQNRQLLDLIQEKYPTIQSLLRADPLSTLRMLRKRDAIITKQIALEVQVEHSGADPQKSWSDYLEKIKQWIDAINHDPILEQARNETAEYIQKAHYERFPKWPAPYKDQKTSILLSTEAFYKTDDDYIVMCAVSGDAEVRDLHLVEKDVHKNDVHKFVAHIEGQPTFKVLCTMPQAMQEVENVAAGHFHEALEHLKQRYGTAQCIEDL